MNPDRWKRIESVYEAAADLAGEERAALLTRECTGDAELRREVESLLRSDEAASGFLEKPAFVIPTPPPLKTLPDDQPATMVGRRIGSFRITGVIGGGGMGVVYLAEQEFPRRIVALKVVKPSLATPGMVRRFEHEAEILGRLHHPGIAQIYEAGAAPDHENPIGSGIRAFFAMEYVRGRSIIEYADGRAMSTAHRLELFAKVCDAVQHAHQKGVIHRDLKPANILVDEAGLSHADANPALAQPKVLDFGVARVTDSDRRVTTMRTSVGQLIGTLPYMSPEQVTGDPDEIDTRSDVYALGVILYELLSGRLPHDLTSRSIPEAARIIRDDAPARLSAVSRVFRGEVDTIVAKAIDKNRARRYQSASDLGDDIRRHLRGEPIAAKRDSALYVLRKQINRYKGAVAAAAIFVISLVTFSAVMFFQSRENRHLALEAVESRENAFAALAEAKVQRERADRTAADLARQLTISNIERARLVAITGSPVVAEDLIWTELLRDPASAPAYWALWEYYLKRPCVRAVPGLSSPVRICILSGDGNSAFAGMEDSSVAILDGRLERVRRVVALSGGNISTIASSTDGQRAIAGAEDGGIWLIEQGSEPPQRKIGSHKDGTNDVWISPDGKTGLSASIDRTVWRWDLDRSVRTASTETLREPVINMFPAPDGRSVLVGLRDGAILRWDFRDGASPEPMMNGEKLGRCLALHPESGVLAVTDDAGDVHLVNTNDWTIIRTFKAARTMSRAGAFTRDGKTLYIGSDALEAWNVETGERIATLIGIDPLLYRMSISPDGAFLAAWARERTVRVFDAMNDPGRISIRAGMGWIFDTPFSNDGSTIACVGHDETVALWDWQHSRELRLLCGHAGRVYRAEYSPNGRLLATAAVTEGVRLWDAASGELCEFWPDGTSSMLSIRFTPDSSRLITGCANGTITVRRVPDGAILGQMGVPGQNVFSVAVSADGQMLASTGSDEMLRLWDIETGTLLTELRCESQPRCVVFSRDGRTIFAGTFGRRIEAWNLATLERVQSMTGHNHAVLSLAVSPDGSILASGGADRTIRLWEPSSGQLLATLEGQAEQVSSVKFHPSGRWVSASDAFSNIYVWDLCSFDRHIAGNLDYQIQRHRAKLPEDADFSSLIEWAGTLRSGSAELGPRVPGGPAVRPLSPPGTVTHGPS